MTDLMYRCAMLEVAVDPGRLYDGDDPYFEIWLSTVLDRVNAKKREQSKAK